MNILIIGSKGFIGSHTFNYFSKKHQVFGCDIIEGKGEEPYFLLAANNTDFSEFFKQKQFDVCINCSGAASVPESVINPISDFHLNVVNVFKILDAIREYNPECKFLNLSSASVYGKPEKLPINEDQKLNPISPYGYHKLLAENICKEFYQLYKIQTCSARIFSAYGIGLKKQIFWDLFIKMKTQNAIELFGTGEETRDFIHVNDLAIQLGLIIQNAPFKADKINIANGKQNSLKEIVTIFAKAMEFEGAIIFNGQNRIGDPKNWIADISIIQKMGYQKSICIEEGIKEYINWVTNQ